MNKGINDSYKSAKPEAPAPQPPTTRIQHFYEGDEVMERESQPSRSVSVPIKSLLAIRDAIISHNLDEAYHQLYLLADPACCSQTPWKAWEEMAEGGKESNGPLSK